MPDKRYLTIVQGVLSESTGVSVFSTFLLRETFGSVPNARKWFRANGWELSIGSPELPPMLRMPDSRAVRKIQ
jgi:hypothetical protein